MGSIKNWMVPLAAIVLAACGDPAFQEGQMVKMKVSGVKGMVVYSRCFLRASCMYTVRFPALALRTNVNLLGIDGHVTLGTSTLLRRIHEFELEAAP